MPPFIVQSGALPFHAAHRREWIIYIKSWLFSSICSWTATKCLQGRRRNSYLCFHYQGQPTQQSDFMTDLQRASLLQASTGCFATSSRNHLHLPGQTALQWIKLLGSSLKNERQKEVVVVLGTFTVVEIPEPYFYSSFPGTSRHAGLGPISRKPIATFH